MIKKIIYQTTGFISRCLSFNYLKKILNNNVFVLNYHSIKGEDVDPYISNTEIYRTADEFAKDIKFLCKNFSIISAVELSEIIKTNKKIPSNLAVITLDDGLRINHTIHAPILSDYKVPATFFVNNAFIDNKDLHFGRKQNLILQNINGHASLVEEYLKEKKKFITSINHSVLSLNYHNTDVINELLSILHFDLQKYLDESKPYLSSEEIKNLIINGFSIGGHSIDHPNYNEISLVEKVRQTKESIDTIVSDFNLPYRLFAFPYGGDNLDNHFFSQIRNHVDLTFGMRGFVKDPVAFHIHRSEIESSKLPVNLALKSKFILSYFKKRVKKPIALSLLSASFFDDFLAWLYLNDCIYNPLPPYL